jgi:hypothetical protein
MDHIKLAYFTFEYVEHCTKCRACKGHHFKKEIMPKPQDASDTE